MDSLLQKIEWNSSKLKFSRSIYHFSASGAMYVIEKLSINVPAS